MRGYIFFSSWRACGAPCFFIFLFWRACGAPFFLFLFFFLRRACGAPFFLFVFPLARLRRAVSPFCPPFRIPKNPVKNLCKKKLVTKHVFAKNKLVGGGGGASPNPDHLDSILRYYLDRPPPTLPHTLPSAEHFSN